MSGDGHAIEHPGRTVRDAETCGADRDRTDDLRLAKPALSQLSYSPELERATVGGAVDVALVGQGRLELPTSRLSGVRSNHLSYWPSRFTALLSDSVRRRSGSCALHCSAGPWPHPDGCTLGPWKLNRKLHFPVERLSGLLTSSSSCSRGRGDSLERR
jgi:hypothetical protein